MPTFTGHIDGAAIIFDWAVPIHPPSVCLSACLFFQPHSLSDRRSLQTFWSGACLAKKLKE